MKILNYLRIKFHPLRYLKSFNSIRNILNKLDFIYYKKSKKFGNYYCNFIKNLNLIINEENYEKETFKFISSIEKKNINDGVFIDVGSNIGLFSYFVEKNFNSQIISFEPDYNNLILSYKTLQKRNNNRIFIFPFGVSNSNAIKSFLLDDVSGSTGSLKGLVNTSQKLYELYKSKKITTYKLDELLNYNFSCINLIKIDVEGGELDVIEGGINLIKKHSPMIIIETDELNLKKINEILTEFGYQYKLIDKEASNFLFFINQKFKSNVNN